MRSVVVFALPGIGGVVCLGGDVFGEFFEQCFGTGQYRHTMIEAGGVYDPFNINIEHRESP